MVSFRGDAWKFYLKLRKTSRQGNDLNQLEEITELENIQSFYEKLDERLLKKVRYRMIKEKKGSGMVPVFVSTVPWLLFIFSKQLQSWLFQNEGYLWIGFVILYLTILISSVVIHFRENA